MRFDDMIATVLGQGQGNPSALAAKWRQLVDLLAQRREVRTSKQAADAIDWLGAHRHQIPADTRCAVARSLSGRRVSPAAIAFFADDKPTVAGPLIAGALLTRDEWIALLPSLTPT